MANEWRSRFSRLLSPSIRSASNRRVISKMLLAFFSVLLRKTSDYWMRLTPSIFIHLLFTFQSIDFRFLSVSQSLLVSRRKKRDSLKMLFVISLKFPKCLRNSSQIVANKSLIKRERKEWKKRSSDVKSVWTCCPMQYWLLTELIMQWMKSKNLICSSIKSLKGIRFFLSVYKKKNEMKKNLVNWVRARVREREWEWKANL